MYVLPLWSGTGGLSKTRKDEVAPVGDVIEADVMPGSKVKTDMMSIMNMYNSITNDMEAFKKKAKRKK